jgi:hypothetical protein
MIVGDKRRLNRRAYYQAMSMMLLLPLVGILFVVGVDARRLGEYRNHPRLFQTMAEEMNAIIAHHAPLYMVSGSDRRILVENHLSDSNAATNQDTHNTNQGETNIKNPSRLSNEHGSNQDTSESSNILSTESSINENTFTELQVEDIDTILREGTSPIEIFQGSHGLLFCILLAVCVSIFTAWQVADNPDGAYSSLCRWTVSVVGRFLRFLLFPLNVCFHFNDRGHLPLATSDYGYKDPSMEFS